MKAVRHFIAILAVICSKGYAAPHAVPVPSHELKIRSDNPVDPYADRAKVQIARIQALLPLAMTFNMWRYATTAQPDFSSISLSETTNQVNQTVYGPQCYKGIAPPPNIADCSQVINQIVTKDFTIELYAGYCGTFEYRSCLAYTCTSDCEKFVLLSSKNAWMYWLPPTKDQCVDKGYSGYAYADGDPGWNAGLVNIAEEVPVIKPNKCSTPGNTR